MKINKDLIVDNSTNYSLNYLANWIQNENDKTFLGTTRNVTYLLAKCPSSYSGPSSRPMLTLYGNRAGNYQRPIPFILSVTAGSSGEYGLSYKILGNKEIGNKKVFKLYQGYETEGGTQVSYVYLVLEVPNYGDLCSLKVLDRKIFTLLGQDITSSYTTWKSGKTLLATEALNLAIEKGSNANGTYLKFDNGVMICYGNHVGSKFNCTSSGGSGKYYYVDTNNSAENAYYWTFPQEFVSTDDLVTSVSVASSAYSMASIGYKRTTGAAFYCVLPYSVTDVTFTWNCIAIGRWK